MFKELVKYYLEYFQQYGEPAIKTICNCVVPNKIILEEYKKLPPIEQMPEKEKSEMKKYVIEMFPEKTPEQKVEACKIVYTIGTLYD